MSGADVPVCANHPDRESHLRCRGCGRPTCPECQHVSPGGGFVCRDCAVAEDATGRPAEPRRVAHQPDQTPPPPPTRRRAPRPVVTFGFGIACIVLYGLQWLVPSITAMGDFSAVTGYVEPWRFMTATFLHSPATVTHLLFNLMGLYVMGQFVEPALGRARFAAIYLLSGLGGSVGYLLLLPALTDMASVYAWSQPVVGASGAIFGLFGAAFLVLRRSGAAVGGMVVLVALNLALPLVYPNIAWQAHLGGAVTGLVSTGIVLATLRRPPWTWAGLAGVLIALVLAALVVYQLNAAALLSLRVQF
ncbi:MAG: rhomboid family intramembrane serine protease [Mobilicoccus sp.]|nr:rhomboid family intramembrane serine protease [Mobilicoccus sp.]